MPAAKFFIGVFFPLDIIPEVTLVFSEALPFTKMVDTLKEIMTRNLPFDAVIPELI